MKKNYIFIALVMVAALSMVSCKNNKKTASQEPTQEEIQAQKQALSDSTLTVIDEIFDRYGDARSNAFIFRALDITEEEKMVQPDYLLDISVVNSLVNREQKINALGILISDIGVRMLYGMPVEETQETIAKLCAELNLPVDSKPGEYKMNMSEHLRDMYNKFKEQNDVSSFWRFQTAVVIEASYILAQNPDFYFGKISEEQFQSYVSQTKIRNEALRELAKYDEEMAEAYQLFVQAKPFASDDDMAKVNASKEANIQYRKANVESITARRNALLQ